MTTHGPAESDPGQRDSPGGRAFQALRCPFCHQAADKGATACDGCGARLHPGCWQEADGRCSSCGRRSAVPAARLSPRQRFAAIPAVCLAALALVIGSAALVVRENARNKDVAFRQRACAALSDDLEWITVIESAPGTPASPHRQLWQIEVHTERRALSAEQLDIEGARRSALVESVEVRACLGLGVDSAEAPPLVVGVRLAPSAQGCSLDVCIGDLSSMGKAEYSLPGETFVSTSGAATIAGPGPFRCIETRDGAVLYRHTLVLVQREF